MTSIYKAIASLAVLLSLGAQAQTPTASITNVTVTPSSVANQYTLGATITLTPAVVAPPVIASAAIKSVSASPSSVSPGANVTTSSTATATVSMPVLFTFTYSTPLSSQTIVVSHAANLVAGTPFTQTDTLAVPSATPAGQFTSNVSVTSPDGTKTYDSKSASWTVAATAVIPPPVVVPPPVVTPPVTVSATLPGPNAALYAAPFYQCKANYYVSTTGKDTNAGTQSSPWLTIQHADTASRQPGDCINVAAGTYKTNVLIQHGGNAPTPTGYVAYRCQTLDGCHVLAASAGHLWGFRNAGSFTVVDGFELDGNAAANSGGLADACFDSDDATYGVGNGSHHLWAINNIIHDCNLSGVQLNNREWFYVLHNRVYNNSFTSGYQGSGISLVVAQCIEAGNASCWKGSTYVPSGMDLTFAPNMHDVVQGNVAYGNMIAANNPVTCGSHTDGNGIIMDTFMDDATNTVVFPYQSLVEGNLTYANGGRGVHIFATSNVTVANNTAYGNGTDQCIAAYYLGDFSMAGGSNNVWVNNVAQSVMTAVNSQCQYCGGRNAALVAGSGRGQADNNNSYLNFVLGGPNPTELFDNAATDFKPASNKVGVDPKLTSPPSNFVPASGSPAINYAATGYGVTYSGACDPGVKTCP